jgi:hypothetical protein
LFVVADELRDSDEETLNEGKNGAGRKVTGGRSRMWSVWLFGDGIETTERREARENVSKWVAKDSG